MGLLKPARWPAQVGLAEPHWRWAWRGLRLAVIGWEAAGSPLDVLNRYRGVLTGALTWEPGSDGPAFRFSANTDRLDYGTEAQVGVTGLATDATSIFGYAKMTGAGSGYQYLFHRSPGFTGSQPVSLLVQPGATPTMHDWNKEQAALPADPNGDGRFHTYGITHLPGGGAGDGQFYFDGARLAAVAAGGGLWSATTATWKLGANPEPNHGWVGPTSCAYLWNRALTDAEHRMLAADPYGPLRMQQPPDKLMARAFDGATWVDAVAVRTHDGTAWVDAVDARTSDGTAWG